MKLIIAGIRGFNNLEVLSYWCDKVIGENKGVEIVSGMCRGTDLTGVRYATKKGYIVKKFPADWNKHGRAAGPIRNREMAEYANTLIAFWDGKSRGTKNMIEEARRNNLSINVIKLPSPKE